MKNKHYQKMDKYQHYFKDLMYKNSNQCPDSKLLFEYINKKLPKKKKQKIKEHLNFCPFCLQAIQSLLSTEEIKNRKQETLKNWNKIEKELDDKFYASLDSLQIKKKEIQKVPDRKKYFNIFKKKWRDSIHFLSPGKVLAYAGSIAVILIICTYSIAFFSRSDNFYLAEIKPEKQVTLRTGMWSESFLAKGMESFNQENYTRAIKQFQTILKNNPDNYTANYYAGLSYLLTAKKGLPGLPYKYELTKVKAGIKFLTKALQSSGENKFYIEDCYWYLGKAYLMKGDVSKSREYFEKILNISHPNLIRSDDAQEILIKLK